MRSAPAKTTKSKKGEVSKAATSLGGASDPDPARLQKLFAANVKLVRKGLLLTQEDLAHEAGLDRTYVSSIERGLRNVSIQNIQRLASALNIDPRDLLDPALRRDERYGR